MHKLWIVYMVSLSILVVGRISPVDAAMCFSLNANRYKTTTRADFTTKTGTATVLKISPLSGYFGSNTLSSFVQGPDSLVMIYSGVLLSDKSPATLTLQIMPSTGRGIVKVDSPTANLFTTGGALTSAICS